MKNKTIYFPELDVLRFLAFLGIYIYHTIPHQASESHLLLQGISHLASVCYLSIDFFFVLSSFLLTYLALEEYKRTQAFSIRQFLIRRTLRIWPLYYFILFIGFVCLPTIAGIFGQTITTPDPFYFLFFLSNYNLEPMLFLLAFLWSIAVEEQFYICWAFVLKFLLQKLPWVITCLFIGFISFKIYALQNGVDTYHHTLNYLPNFASGALLAWFCQTKATQFKRWTQIPTWQITLIWASIIGIFLSVSWIYRNLALFTYVDNIVLSLCFAFIIAEQAFFKHSIYKLSRLKKLIYPGKITYGLYCYHGLALTLSYKALDILQLPYKHHPVMILVNLILSFIFAHLSYRYLELFFLRLKKRNYS